MKKNNGLILSMYIYILLVFFLLILSTMLMVLNNTKILATKMKNNISSQIKVDENDFSIILVGNKDVVCPLGMEYVDEGYIAQTTTGVNITATAVSTVNIDVEGTYTYTYTVLYGGVTKSVVRNIEIDAVEYSFDYTGDGQTFVAPYSGYYKLEVWGAQGGDVTYASNSNIGGYGGYAVGSVYLDFADSLYIYVGSSGQGGIGSGSTLSSSTSTSGYNGGGYIGFYSNNSLHGGGGGATHIATTGGLLSTLSSNQSTILIVAGGGGGASVHNSYTSYSGIGGSGGGYIGVTGVPNATTCYNYGTGGTQASIGSYIVCSVNGHDDGGDVMPQSGGFGKGTNYISYIINQAYAYAGGGGGYYGGWSGYHGPAGGGSGYIANSLLLSYGGITKAMYCYNCTESSDSTTLTYSVTDVSETATSNYAKSGNGYAKITYIGS